MPRNVKSGGRLAMAALAATALLAPASRPAGAQEVMVPSPREAARIVIPGAVDDGIFAKNKALEAFEKEFSKQREAQAAAQALIAASQKAVLEQRAVAVEEALQQLRPTFVRELRLFTSTAEASPAQRREIALEAGRRLRANVVEVAKAQVRQPVQAKLALIDPPKLVRSHLEFAALAKLPRNQADRYLEDRERRAQARREAVLLNIVAILDRHLALDLDQREKLCESLRAHWDDRDYPSPENFAFSSNDLYVPILPDPYILPILADEQRKVWRGLRKYHLNSIRGVNSFQALLDVEIEEAEDVDVKDALARESKP